MSNETVFHFSRIEFRRNPADADSGVIPLGFAVSFATETYKAIGLALNSIVDSKYLDALDDLSKGVLAKRSEIIEQEISDLLSQSVPHNDILMQLAARNQWSIHISSPLQEKIMADNVVDTVSLEKLLESFVFTLYRQKMFDPHVTVARASAVLPTQREHSYTFNSAALPRLEPIDNDYSEPWISPPKVWRMPKLDSVSRPLYA